mmetsp:Transcript_132860/g.413078  ORF Transcript_132860/g.413078 Transcript_132860/m.413078 type:complete len:235 (-) Transcript_132860:217-921(-)
MLSGLGPDGFDAVDHAVAAGELEGQSLLPVRQQQEGVNVDRRQQPLRGFVAQEMGCRHEERAQVPGAVDVLDGNDAVRGHVVERLHKRGEHLVCLVPPIVHQDVQRPLDDGGEEVLPHAHLCLITDHNGCRRIREPGDLRVDVNAEDLASRAERGVPHVDGAARLDPDLAQCNVLACKRAEVSLVRIQGVAPLVQASPPGVLVVELPERDRLLACGRFDGRRSGAATARSQRQH